jgi:hypothetical protein
MKTLMVSGFPGLAPRCGAFLRGRLPKGARLKSLMRMLRLGRSQAAEILAGRQAPTAPQIEELYARFGEDFLRDVFAEAWAAHDARIQELQAQNAETRRRLAEMEARLAYAAGLAGTDAAVLGGECSGGDQLSLFQRRRAVESRQAQALTSLAAALGTGPAAWWHRRVAPLLWRAA